MSRSRRDWGRWRAKRRKGAPKGDAGGELPADFNHDTIVVKDSKGDIRIDADG